MKKVLLITITIIGAFIVLIMILRLLTLDDTWIKDVSGTWIKHGNSFGTPPN